MKLQTGGVYYVVVLGSYYKVFFIIESSFIPIIIITDFKFNNNGYLFVGVQYDAF